MKEIKIIPMDSIVTDFLKMEPGIKKRNMFYTHIAERPFSNANLLIKDDGTIHYSFSLGKVKRNGEKYYISYSGKKGFTLDNNGKFKVWFGHKVTQISYWSLIFKALEIDWFPSYLEQSMSSSLVAKILTGKITNPLDYVKALVKVMRYKCSPQILLNVLSSNAVSSTFSLHTGLAVAKDPNHYLEYCINKDNRDIPYSTIFDMERQALILNRKIDYNWSKRRMNEEHAQWTRELMDIEKDSLDSTPLSWLEPYQAYMPEYMTLLDNEQAVFIEGKLMCHCVYTNYWQTIKNQKYIAIAVDYQGERGTLGLMVTPSGKLDMHQFHGKHNNSMSLQITDKVCRCIDEINQQIVNALTDGFPSVLHELPF